MALTFKTIPEQHFQIGPSAGWKALQATPAASDYATGGYLITPAQVGMYNIIGAVVIGTKYQAGGTILWQINQPSGNYGTSPVESTTGVYLTAWEAAASTPSGTISIPIGTNVGTTSPVYAGNVANTFTTTGSATSVTNATFTGAANAAADFSEVGAGTDLSGFPLWILFIGY
jgi:hypothetical protein